MAEPEKFPDPAAPARRARDFADGQLLYDYTDPKTLLRGMVIRGPFSFCAYVGVPSGHVLESLEELEFITYRGITWRDTSERLGLEPGWFMFGWDYAHAGDRLCTPPGMPDFSIGLLGRDPKDWTLEEVVEHVLDALLELHYALEAAQGIPTGTRPVVGN